MFYIITVEIDKILFFSIKSLNLTKISNFKLTNDLRFFNFKNSNINNNLSKFSTNIFKNGLKIKFLKILNFFFFSFFSFFFLKNSSKSNYSYSKEIYSLLLNNYYMNNYVTLSSWLLSNFYFLFYLRKKNKIKNKSNQLNNFKIDFLNKKKRSFYMIKFFKNLIFLNKKIKIKNNLLFFFFDLFLNYKESRLYIQKINIYKKFLLS